MANPRKFRKLHTLALRISLLYLLFGAVWVFLTHTLYTTPPDIDHPVYLGLSAVLVYVLIRFNFREQSKLENSLSLSEERWKFALEGAGEGVWDWDLKSDVVFRSGQWFKIYGYSESEVGTTAAAGRTLMHSDDVPRAVAEMEAHLQGISPIYSSEYRMRCKDGSWKWVLSRGMIVSRDSSGQPERMIGTHTDISERKRHEEEIFRIAHYDKVTGLANRVLFQNRLHKDIEISKRSGHALALMYLDLDRFKEINDTLGHDIGDKLLEAVAARLNTCVRSSDTVARLGGDEFTIILNHQNRLADVERVAQDVLDRLAEPFELAGQALYLSASLGITIAPDDGSDAEALLKNADQAMYAAKAAGGNTFNFFTASMQEASLKRMHITADLRTALAEDQFELYYQPIVEMATGTITKAEALIRWNHPTRGLVSPIEFIPVAEEKGLIVDIGDQVFLKAAQQVQQWRERFPGFQLSINKSPLQIRQNRTTRLDWLQHLEDINLPGDALVIEITEGVLLDASEHVSAVLKSYQQAGIRVAIDDFGTGYSSLAYIRKFHIHFVKIDRAFTAEIAPESENLALCEAIIVMAHKLGMKVIAEGVETEQQHNLLHEAGCDYGQGYYYARPVPAAQFEALPGLTQPA